MNLREDLYGEPQGSQVLFGVFQPAGVRAVGGGAQEVADFQFQRVVFVNEDPLDERLLAVSELFLGEGVLGRGAAMDVDVLLRVVQKDVRIPLGDGQGSHFVLCHAAGGQVADAAVLEGEPRLRTMSKS